MKCGLSKTSKYFPQCLLLLSLVLLGLFGLGLKNASASILYDYTVDLPLVYSTDGGCGATTSDMLGYADNVESGACNSSSAIYVGTNRNFGTTTLPVGANVDAVSYSVHGHRYTGCAASGYSGVLKVGTLTKSLATPDLTGSLGYANYIYDNTNLTPTELLQLTQANFDVKDGTHGFSFGISCGGATASVNIDSITRTFWYHYDTSLSQSKIHSFIISPLNSSTYPNIVSATSSITTTYYYNSADDTASSTAYTRLQYKLHDFFTNQDSYTLTLPITKDTTYATSTINNLCAGGLANCANGDTYQLAVRFSNDDGSVVSGWFPTYYYFAYIAYTPTPTATTSVIIIGNGFDTGTTTIDVNTMYTDCGLTNLAGCFQNALVWAFVPSSNAIQNFYTFQTTITSKAPMGYFTVVKNNLNGLNSTSSPAFAVVIPAHLKTYIFTPFDTAIAGILWFFFAVHFYKRLKTITV